MHVLTHDKNRILDQQHVNTSITPVATKVHVILWSYVVLTWMHDTLKFV